MFKALRSVVDAAWSDETSAFPIFLVFALIGLVISLLAALNGVEMIDAEKAFWQSDRRDSQDQQPRGTGLSRKPASPDATGPR
jgi:hypothetical protein